MNINVVSNDTGNILKFFEYGLNNSTNFDWASAYASKAGYNLISSKFETFLKKGGKSRAIFDLAQGLTDPQIIEELLTISGDSQCKVFVGDNTVSGIFHHKFYNLYDDDKSNLLMGSANFTKSGLTVNKESAIVVSSSVKENLYQESLNLFEDKIWNIPGAISLEGKCEILEMYKEIYNTRSEFQSNLNSKLPLLKKSIMDHYHYLENYQNFTPFVAYLCGILCANSQYNSKDARINRTVSLKFKSSKNNKNTEDEGYICTRDENNSLLGGIRLEQTFIEVKSMERLVKIIEDELSKDSDNNQIFLKNQSKINTNIDITIKFSEESNIWCHILNCLDEFSVSGKKTLIPTIPSQIQKSDDPEIIKNFIRGYFDFRAAVTKGHRAPGGPMRIGVMVDTQALEFAKDFKTILNKLKIEHNFNDGTSRNRDHIIRIIPDRNTTLFFSSGWKQIMAQEYADYNESFK
tara:strand:- start:30 stop:1418 length:1389 start_codon:yes stop_codon:yes gene_type:complete